VTLACQRAGLKICEVPIFFEERRRGRSKLSSRIILEALWRVWQIRLRR
jgi:dolichol-phosphate mannosyltransferase